MARIQVSVLSLAAVFSISLALALTRPHIDGRIALTKMKNVVIPFKENYVITRVSGECADFVKPGLSACAADFTNKVDRELEVGKEEHSVVVCCNLMEYEFCLIDTVERAENQTCYCNRADTRETEVTSSLLPRFHQRYCPVTPVLRRIWCKDRPDYETWAEQLFSVIFFSAWCVILSFAMAYMVVSIRRIRARRTRTLDGGSDNFGYDEL